jgi:hypothetical protein
MRHEVGTKAFTMNITELHKTIGVVDEALGFALGLRAARWLLVCRRGRGLPGRMRVLQTGT